MAENEVEVLSRDKAEKENILPTGRKVGIKHLRGTSMYYLTYVDGKAGDIPSEYQSKFTGLQSAERELRRFVRELWDVSDRSTRRTKAQSSQVANAVS